MSVLLATVFIDLVGFGMIFPILPFYAQSYGANAFTIMVLVATYSAGQMFAGPLWGRMSDRYGRKPILLLTLFGGALSYIWFAFAPNLTHLFLARGLGGIMSGNIAVAHAYAADITQPEDRARAIGKIGAAFGLGFVAGPALGGLLFQPDSGSAGFTWPFLAAAAMSMIAMLMGIFILREPKTRQGTATKTAGSFAVVFAAAGKNGIPLLISLYLLVTISFTTLIAVFPLWVQARIGWGPLQVGYAYAWIGLLIAGMQGGLIGPLTRRLGETGVFVIGACSLLIGLYLAIYVTSPLTFAANAVLLCAGSSFCQPILTTLTSQRLGPEHQGAVLGLQGAVASFGRIISPPIAGIIFLRFGPDWPLLVASAIMLPVSIKATHMAITARKQGKQ